MHNPSLNSPLERTSTGDSIGETEAAPSLPLLEELYGLLEREESAAFDTDAADQPGGEGTDADSMRRWEEMPDDMFDANVTDIQFLEGLSDEQIIMEMPIGDFMDRVDFLEEMRNWTDEQLKRYASPDPDLPEQIN